MPLLGGDLGHRAGGDPCVMDVVHYHLSVVLLTPFLDVRLIEPLVVGRDEMHPMKDLEGLPGGTGPFGDDDTGADPGRQRPGSHGFDESTATSGAWHMSPPLELETLLSRGRQQ